MKTFIEYITESKPIVFDPEIMDVEYYLCGKSRFAPRTPLGRNEEGKKIAQEKKKDNPDAIIKTAFLFKGTNRPYVRESKPKEEEPKVEKPEPKKEEPPVDEHRQKQFEIIQKTNPMTDDYHTGIRKPSDIMKPEDAFADKDEIGIYPDWTEKMAQNALKLGKLVVYSSHSIKNGTFVSPSYKMAKDYAGSQEPKKKIVDINDVAWINANEGMVAKV